MTDCGNQMVMWISKLTSSGLMTALAVVLLWGCAPRVPSAMPAGVTLQPGRYLTASYRAPDFLPDKASYVLEPFPVQSTEVDPETFQAQLQEELTRAFRANGLKVDPHGDATLKGTVSLVEIRGTTFRFITGKITVYLLVEGTISRSGETLFAFQDLVKLTSPVNPGPPAPKERELLLSQATRTFAVHLLNELLLYGLPAEGK